MAKRYTDTEIWEEDWFIDLPNDYKLFYLYIKDKCDHSGMWRPNKRKFSMVLNGKMIMFDDFLNNVNKTDENTGQKKQRIIVIENGKWFLTKFISFQCGSSFQIKIGAHRGALELLVKNDIHPSKVPNFDWRGIEKYDLQQLKEIVYAKSLYRLCLEDGYSMHSEIEREREKELELEREKEVSGGKGGVGEKPNFKLQGLYDTSFSELDTQGSKIETRGISEPQFRAWRQFVDYVAEQGFEELFKAIFVTPADFARLQQKHGFSEELWHPVIKKMLGTGIKPEQNLYFRIQDYIGYVKTAQGTAGNGSTDLDTGNAGSGGAFSGIERW